MPSVSLISLLVSCLVTVNCAPNLLYIVVDDLRTELGGAYGVQGMITPGIDKLSSEGVTFTRAYTNVPLCSPSRTSFLTGMRPQHTRVWTIGPYLREQAQNANSIVTISQALKLGGWNSTGAGKVWHPGTSSGGAITPSVGGDDMPFSWSYPDANAYNGYWECDQFTNGTVQSPASVSWPGGAGCVQSAECKQCFLANGINGTFMESWTNPDCADSCFPDGLVADRGLAELAWKAEHPDQPFALFLGMKRPHLNFFAPAWAYRLYHNGTTALASSRLPSQGMPEIAFFQNTEIAGAHDVKPNMYSYVDSFGQNFTLVEDWKQHELRWAYRSAVTYMDRQVERVFDGLQSLGLRNNTWVVFHSDHGWSLGEHGEWAKTNNFEEATRVPLIIVPPTGTGAEGTAWARNATFQGIVELIDLFPTLSQILGVPEGIVPAGQLAGDSLVPALRAAPPVTAPGITDSAFTSAFSEICRIGGPQTTTPPPDGSLHGMSIRTSDWRFTAWTPFNYTASAPMWSLWNATWDVELYDHRNDTGSWEDYDLSENINLAREEGYATLVAQLTAAVQAVWPGQD